MTNLADMRTVQPIRQPRTAAAILAHPLRPRILAAARDIPRSASEIARRLDLPRQRVNYHVRQLEAAGLLQPVAQQRKRNMVEQQYIASAQAYVLTQELLGEVSARVEELEEPASPAHLVALCARAETEVATVMESATAAGLRVRMVSLERDVYFDSVDQRADFTRALSDAVADIVARHSSPQGRPFRLILGCYPTPGATT